MLKILNLYEDILFFLIFLCDVLFSCDADVQLFGETFWSSGRFVLSSVLCDYC